MIHPDTELKYISDTVGYGVFAKKFIPEGTIVYVKDTLEIEISPTDFLLHSPPMQQMIEKYSYIDERGVRIISWDFAKYVNHCCDCNTISTGYGFEIAIRDIQPGEEITDEYGLFNMEDKIELACEKPNCRKTISSDDFDKYYKKWDEQIKHSLIELINVEQPLLPLIPAEVREQLDNFFTNQSNYKSVYSLKYKK